MRQLFYFYGYRLKVMRWKKSEIIAASTFEPNKEGFEKFTAFIKGYEKLKTQMLVDIIEEDFQSETIPRVHNSHDKRILIDKALDKYFQNIKYRCALPQGRQKTGRKDEIYLLGALTNTELINPWVEKIRENKINLIGIQSVSTVGEKLISIIGNGNKPTLLVSQQVPWTLRLSFYSEQKLLFSRLVPARIKDISEYPELVFKEVDQTLKYLQFKRLLGADEERDIVLITDSEYQEAIAENLNEDEGYFNLKTSDIRDKIGITSKVDSPCADTIFAYLAEAKATNHYGQHADLKQYRTTMAKTVINTATVILTVAAATICTTLFLFALNYQHATQKADRAADNFNNLYQNESAELDSAMSNANMMKQAVDAIEIVTNTGNYTPLEIITVLANTLNKYPAISLKQLHLNYNNKHTVDFDPLAAPDQMAMEQPQLPATLTVEAEIIGMDDNFRKSLTLVSTFIKSITANDIVSKVDLEKPPIDLTSKAQVEGKTGTADDSYQNKKNSFSIVINYKNKNPTNNTNGNIGGTDEITP